MDFVSENITPNIDSKEIADGKQALTLADLGSNAVEKKRVRKVLKRPKNAARLTPLQRAKEEALQAFNGASLSSTMEKAIKKASLSFREEDQSAKTPMRDTTRTSMSNRSHASYESASKTTLVTSRARKAEEESYASFNGTSLEGAFERATPAKPSAVASTTEEQQPLSTSRSMKKSQLAEQQAYEAFGGSLEATMSTSKKAMPAYGKHAAVDAPSSESSSSASGYGYTINSARSATTPRSRSKAETATEAAYAAFGNSTLDGTMATSKLGMPSFVTDSIASADSSTAQATPRMTRAQTAEMEAYEAFNGGTLAGTMNEARKYMPSFLEGGNTEGQAADTAAPQRMKAVQRSEMEAYESFGCGLSSIGADVSKKVMLGRQPRSTVPNASAGVSSLLGQDVAKYETKEAPVEPAKVVMAPNAAQCEEFEGSLESMISSSKKFYPSFQKAAKNDADKKAKFIPTMEESAQPTGQKRLTKRQRDPAQQAFPTEHE